MDRSGHCDASRTHRNSSITTGEGRRPQSDLSQKLDRSGDGCGLGKAEAARLLLEHGAKFSEPGNGSCELWWAIESGNVETVRVVLEKGADLNAEYTGGSPNLPLVKSALQGKLDIVKLLIERGADIQRTDHNRAAIKAAATGRAWEVVQFLLDKGAKIDDIDYAPNETPSSEARERSERWSMPARGI